MCSGVALFDQLVEGPYRIRGSAVDHRSYDATMLVQGGVTNLHTMFLAVEFVKYSFTVVPTSVPEEYTIRVEQTFVTQVPAPVITVEPMVLDLEALAFAGPESVIYFTITNHGLISAFDTAFAMPPDDGLLEFESLVNPDRRHTRTRDQGRTSASSCARCPRRGSRVLEWSPQPSDRPHRDRSRQGNPQGHAQEADSVVAFSVPWAALHRDHWQRRLHRWL